ncbi:DUF2505 domain-containing protein [Skermania sp. ID1734]|uniref:DUF2505 domain-containing protein n=1 Tax=Skermania sp. ID1734 TaxID=2597516 RepID=UPI00117F60E3|nr:DUF2505 domain-containing protein [Skermania sp. ID1734]TSD99531.1 DUF2505 domain-containing protein [Skermania sp. ID1734]
MARRIDYSARYNCHTTKQVYSALCDRDYWEARVEEMRQYSPNHVESFSVDDSGIELVLHHILPRSELPEIAQAVMRKDMVITRKESYSAFGEEVTGKYEASIPAGPGSLTGTMRLFPTELGCTLRTSSEAKVYIPMVGPKLEQLMLVNLIDLFRAEAEITQTWLDQHYPV